jgi:hypothetical protein
VIKVVVVIGFMGYKGLVLRVMGVRSKVLMDLGFTKVMD